MPNIPLNETGILIHPTTWGIYIKYVLTDSAHSM